MKDITTKTASQSLDSFLFDLQRFDSVLGGTNNALALDVTDGEFSFDETTKKLFIAAGTKIAIVRDEQTISLTATEDISAPY
ncbi:MAG: hypothetical protein SR2Q5_06365, partial [Quinella sp. 2Q5]|nr:hypothetical protein [Quinella sp. 2Q5]